jgi:phosphoglycolate phosphatase
MLDQVEGNHMKDGDAHMLSAPRAILFDLDGTLVDSASDLAASVNELVSRSGLPPLSLDRVKSMIGGGLRALAERAFAATGKQLSGAALETAETELVEIYLGRLTHTTRLMPGAERAISECHAAGLLLGVVTNKPQVATRKILLHFGLIDRIGAIIGGDAVVNKKPAPDALLLALDQLGVAPSDALMIGDSATDVAAARAAGMPVILVRGGYSQVPVDQLGADLVCDDLQRLPATVLRLPSAA